ncbi:MAG: alkyl hydroperoxide reductase, partial [Gammaproteobacteria bacterium]
AMGISVYAIYQLSITTMNIIWLGALMINLPIMLFISRVMMFKDMPRTSAHFPLITLLAVLGVILAFYNAYFKIGLEQLTSMDQIGYLLSVISFAMYLMYNFWYSSLGRGLHPLLEKNKILPPFNVTDIHGKLVNSTDFKGSPVVFLFFRGNWCPLCMAQIKEIAISYQELTASGAKVVLISPQPEKNTQALAAKFNVPLNFMTDIDNRAAKTLGIYMQNGLPAGMEMFGYDKDTVYPTVIITDKQGKIIYSDFTDNYRVRPEPQDFIDVLKEATS